MKGVNVGDEVRKKEPSYDAELETPDSATQMKGVNVGDEVREKEPSYDAELETPDLEEIKQKDKERLRHLRRQQKEALLRARMQQNQLVEAEEVRKALFYNPHSQSQWFA